MRKQRLLLIIFSLMATCSIYGQNNQFNKFELGADFSNHFLGYSDGGTNKKYEFGLYGEWHHYITKSFSYGCRVDYTAGPVYINNREINASGLAHFLGAYGVATLDILTNQYIFPVMSLGVGPALGLDNVLQNSAYFMACATLRLGLEMKNHLKVGIGVNFAYDVLHPNMAFQFEPISIFVGWSF